MNGNGPGQFDGVMHKRSEYFFFDFAGLFVEGIFDVVPFVFLHNDASLFVFEKNFNFFAGQGFDDSHFSIVEVLFK
ncbi:hypothetical protein D3C80_1284390 [compost metagenome]